ncbi:centrosomal protein of 131 kDa isoform X2 [Bactrocera oleae]|uniref:centrosomal protein of 131 kDa isoform X2 n=1 Tax=Bactrocera oleae TaxID=104688 RepID=UPI00387EA192
MRSASYTIYKLRTAKPIWLKIENCEKKMVFIALIVALLQAASTEGSNQEPSLDDVPLSIYVDASKEIDYFISLAKSIDEKQRILEEALARLSAEVKATEERWNERLSAEVKETQRLNERMSAVVKATEERWNESVSAEVKATEERWNERMSVVVKATEERWNESVSAEVKATEERWNERLSAEVKETQWLIERMAAAVKATEERWNKRLSAEVKETQRLNERMSAVVKATEERWNERLSAEVKETQWLIESKIFRMSVAVKATEERWNKRLSAEVKATEERWTEKMSILENKFKNLSNQLTKSPDIATLHKRPAELACEKITSKLQSIGVTSITDVAVHLGAFTEGGFKLWELCYFALIDTRFVLTAADCLSSHNVTTLELNLYIVLKKVKAIHIHPEFSINPALNNIGLIEMNSEVEYTFDLYPACMYTSAFNPKSGLMERGTKVQIVADSECLNKHTTQLLPNQMCVKSLTHNCRQKGEPIFVLNEETFSKHQLVGIIGKRSCIDEPYVITNVFAYLDFIESIVWPKKEN